MPHTTSHMNLRTLTRQRLCLSRKKQAGLTLVEILVSVLILSVGLLGLASLQVQGLNNNQTAYYRSVATMLAYGMSDRIRANRVAALAGSYTTAIGDAPSGNTSCVGTGGCSSSTLKTFDINQWKCSLGGYNANANCSAGNLNIQGPLPSGDGSITFANSLYTINITWDDNRDGAVDGSDPTFSMTFLP